MSMIRWPRMTKPQSRDALRRRFAWVLAIPALSLAVTGCDPNKPLLPTTVGASSVAADDDEGIPAGVSGLNYSKYYIAGFSITDAQGRTGGGPNISPSKGNDKPAGGGAEKCCVVVPAKWNEGMTVTVHWERDTRPYDEKDRSGDQWLKAVATVPPYTRLTHGFWVRFLPDDRIVVQVNDQDLYIPDAPMNQERYVVQGVLDDEANQAMQARRERDRIATEEYRRGLKEDEAKAQQQGAKQ